MHWKLALRVSRRDKADKELRRAQELLQNDLQVASREPYWKIPELWMCEATTRLAVASDPDYVMQCLVLADRLATGWIVSGPSLSPDGILESFHGIFDRKRLDAHARLQSLEWGEFGIGG
jgi:hypothetical protein